MTHLVIFVAVFSLIWLPAQAQSQNPSLFIGSDSCATTTCHGNVIGRGPIWNHSMSVFSKDDPHVGAGRLLRRDGNPLSKTIVETLDPDAKSSDDVYNIVLQTRCVSCHTTVTTGQCDPNESRFDPKVLDVGVSCESCHGPASDWIGDHVGKLWIEKRHVVANAMRDTKSIVGRTLTCVRCHIGSRSEDGLVRDMNHDLIAAGHPALRFDLLIYNENLPKHWDVESDSDDRFLASSIQLRNVSRAVNLATSSLLSSERATDHLSVSGAGVPWPEFSDYDCFACHQSLTIDHFDVDLMGQVRSPLRISDGLPIWNSWHTTDLLELRHSTKLLEALSPARSSALQMSTSGRTLSVRYMKIAFDAQSSLRPDAAKSLEDFQESLDKSGLEDWHACAIAYLNLDAISRDLLGKADSVERGAELQKQITQLEKQLRFDKNDTNIRGEYLRSHSPAGFDPRSFRDAMLEILKQNQ